MLVEVTKLFATVATQMVLVRTSVISWSVTVVYLVTITVEGDVTTSTAVGKTEARVLLRQLLLAYIPRDTMFQLRDDM